MSHHYALRQAAIAISLLFAASIQADTGKLAFDIPAEPLEQAVNRIAKQADVQVLLASSLASGKSSPTLKGQYTAREALEKLLAGSGLTIQDKGGNSFIITAAPQKESVLPEVAVKTAAERNLTTEGTGSYAAKGASLMKGTQSLKDIPQSVTVMTRQQMDDQRLDTLTTALANTPGITLVTRPNGGSDIYSRGFLTDTLQYDGVPLSRYHSFGNDLSASAVHLDRIEVMRGAQGLLEGAGSPAGAVNLVRKRGLAETAVMLEGRAGSWDNYGARLDMGGALNAEGTLRGRAVIDYEDKNSFLDTVWDRNLNAYAAIDFDLSPDTTIGLGIAHSRLDGNSALYNGVPRYADGHSLGLSRSANIGASWQEANRRETQVFLDLEHRINDNWKIKAATAFAQDDWEAITSKGNGIVALGGSMVPGPGFTYDNASNSKGLDIHADGKFQALGMAHEVVLGANYSRQKRDDSYSQYWNYTAYDVFNPNHNAPRFNTPSDIWDQTSTTTQKGIYALLRSHLTEHTTLVLGGRTNWYDFHSHGSSRIDGYEETTERKETGEFIPYGGLVYALTPQWSAYASYAEIFNPQSATDTLRKVLPPMTGKSYEAGIKGELFDGALNASLAVFRVDQKNRAVLDYSSPMTCNGWYCSRAAGEVRSEGFEAEAHGQLAPGLQVSGGYTYTKNKYLEDTDESLVGKPFNYLIPKHMLRLWSNYQLPGELNKWRVGLGVNYRSEQKTSSDTMLNPVQGGYAIWNARIGYDIDKHWSAALNVDNLLDKRYYSFISDNYFYSYAGEPRKVLLTLRWQY
ncbi:TonB-dependent siderophore receptor [Methylobacillus sp. Pita1]|uniref:TonB-dependent siderophore receptor n=1 Tax=Methylobacillus sp. Pita1 TaxID=3382642 RepID=UPI0038B67FF3